MVTAASATAGITATLLAFRIPVGSLCLLPSWTFVATAHAVRAAGLIPFFHDVDRQTWALNPDQIRETLSRMSSRVGAVIAVSPFGAPLDIVAWETFQDRCGIPVLVDAAAGFDTLRATRIPSVVSLHATKILAAGEGGFVTTTDALLLERIRSCSNFGFCGFRNALWPAVNSKMSESTLPSHSRTSTAGPQHASSRLESTPGIDRRSNIWTEFRFNPPMAMPGLGEQPTFC